MFSEDNILILGYVGILLLIIIFYLRCKSAKVQKSLDVKKEEKEAGLTEPASLHPIIDPDLCLGCGACVTACPEQNVLGLIHNKAELIAPTHCIGHGACDIACPLDAITLVFGTEKRGVDIPFVQPTYETNVPAIYIAGELGGMGLIRNAVRQGKLALENILDSEYLKAKASDDVYDVIIVGAGPSGLSASLAALENKLKYLTLEQDILGGAPAHYPRGKLVMTQPVDMPIVGKTTFGETTKEELLEFWYKTVAETGVEIKVNERVAKVEKIADIIEVTTQNATYKTKSVLLTIGRMGTPRKLGVPGEEATKVVYRLTDPEQYDSKHVVVVGGGDSALEAALAIAERPDTNVRLSYRSDAFGRAKQKNRDRIDAAKADGSLNVLMKSNVKEVTEDEIIIDHDGEIVTLKNEAIIVCAGGILPTGFLKEIGIDVETKHGTV